MNLQINLSANTYGYIHQINTNTNKSISNKYKFEIRQIYGYRFNLYSYQIYNSSYRL